MAKAMKATFVSVFTAALMSGAIYSGVAFAGNETSGGGAVAVCRDSAGRILSAQLLDLYEGEIRFGLSIPRSKDSADFQLGQMLSRLDGHPVLRGRLALAIREVIQRIEFLPSGVGLSPGVDLGQDYGVIVPEGCRLEYAAFYEATGKIKVARGVFSALPPTDQAALVVHEAVYRLARDRGHRNSAKSRVLTATLFAMGVSETNLLKALRENSAADRSNDFDLYYAHYPVPAPTGAEPIRIRAVATPIEPGNVSFRLTYVCQDCKSWEQNEREGTGQDVSVELTGSQNAGQGSHISLMEAKGLRSAAFSFRLYLNDVQVASGMVPTGANTVLFLLYETPALPTVPMP
jgi:hypothetical protein